MKLDHIAYRVADREATVEYLKNFSYKPGDEFDINFDDGSTAKCTVLEPKGVQIEAHEEASIFVSEGSPGSIVDRWVQERQGLGGVHHLAYEVDDVEETMAHFCSLGTEFLSDEPLSCEGLVQVFTTPDPFTGIIYEFISYTNAERRAFCKDNVKDLMLSTEEQ